MPAQTSSFQDSIAQVSHRIRVWAEARPKPVRMLIGVLLVCGGFLGFLPILGFWMVPLGLLILSIDVPWLRRAGRWIRLRWLQRRRAAAARTARG